MTTTTTPQPQASKSKGLRIATRCTSVEQFVAAFKRFCDEQSFFISTLATRPVGLETPFSVDLVSGAPALRGLGVVLGAWSTAENRFGRPGVHIGVRRLTSDSERVFEQLLIARAAAADPATTPPPPIAPTPPPPIPQVRAKLATPPPSPTIPAASPSRASVVTPAVAPVIPTIRGITHPPSPIVKPPVAIATTAPIRNDATLPRVASPRPSAVIVDRPPVEPPVIVRTYTPLSIPPSFAPVPASSPAPPVEVAPPPIDVAPPVEVALPPIDVAPPRIDVAPPPRAPTIDEIRTPGSDLVLPANPLTGITDESLEGFVDCTIYEETGNFFPVEAAPDDPDLDPIASPPVFAPITSARAAVAPPPDVPTQDDAPAFITEPPIPAEPPSEIQYAPPAYDYTPPMQQPSHGMFGSPPLEYPLATPPFAMDALAPPLPARPHPGVTAEIAIPRPRPNLRWYALGGAAFLLVVTIIVVAAKSSAAAPESHETAARTAEPAMAVTPPAAPIAAKSQPAIASDTPPEPEEPQVGGMPVVGKGPCRMTIMTTPAGSTVQLDGLAVGPSPITVDGPCQRRQLAVAHARYQGATQWVTPTPGKAASVEVVLQRPTHSLMIETAPLGATISIGGRRAGTSPTMVELMGFSSIAITITKPGYAPITKRIYSKQPSDKLFVRLVRQ
ncbi:MAG: hypothetical protein JWO36_6726 [Myxococcales bacterium]|nr:hypothetical protein [Myxococcales bacterium]